MGLILLGSRNLASDEADQRPTVIGRKKETTGPQWPEPWIEKIDIGGGNYRIVFHYYREWPGDEWAAMKSGLNNHISEVDMSECSMKEVGAEAFRYEWLIERVTLPPKVETLGNYAFENCGVSIANFSIVLPETLKEIGNSCFHGCTKLQLDALPDSIETIGNDAFSGANISISKLPAKLKTLGSSVFNDTDITISKIEETVETVGVGAFKNCSGITNIEIAAKSVDYFAFRDNQNLEKVWFRSSCETIIATAGNRSPFFNCSADIEIYAEPDSKPAGWSSYYNYTSNPATAVTVTYGQKTSPF